MSHAYESPHSDRNVNKCVCFSHSLSLLILLFHSFLLFPDSNALQIWWYDVGLSYKKGSVFKKILPHSGCITRIFSLESVKPITRLSDCLVTNLQFDYDS